MPFKPFVPLRVLSAYSMLEGAIEPKAMAKLAKERGFPAIALADLPMRFFHSTDDPVVAPEHLSAWAHRFPHARCYPVSRAAHMSEGDLSWLAIKVAIAVAEL